MTHCFCLEQENGSSPFPQYTLWIFYVCTLPPLCVCVYIYIYIYIYLSLVCSVFQAIMKSLYLYKARTQTPTFVMLALFQRSLSWHTCASDVWFLISLSNSRRWEETGGRSVQQCHRLPFWWRQKAATGTFTFSPLAQWSPTTGSLPTTGPWKNSYRVAREFWGKCV